MSEQAEKIAGSELTPIAEYTQTALALADLRHRFQGLVVNVSTPKGLKEAKANVAELRTLRTGLESKRKELKAPILERGKLLDDEAKRITAEIVALEDPIKLQVEAEEARIEAEKLARIEAERLRVEALRGQIQAIRDLPSTLVGKPSVIIAGQLEKLRERVLDEAEFAELYAEASDALAAATARAQDILAAQKEQEAEQARIKAERDELEKLRREAEQRHIEDNRKAKAEDERVQRIRDRISELGFVAPIANWSSERVDAYIAERLKLDPRDADDVFDYGEWRAEACDVFDKAISNYHDARREIVRREREEYEAAERRAEQDRLRQEREAELSAERVRLEKERAEFQRQQREAAAKAKAERLANLGLREAAQAVVQAFELGKHAVIDDLRAVLVRMNEAETKPVRAKKVASA